MPLRLLEKSVWPSVMGTIRLTVLATLTGDGLPQWVTGDSVAMPTRPGVILSVLVAFAASCGAPPAATQALAGQIVAAGGGGALPQVQALAKRFSELHPRVTWDIEELGSTGAIQLARNGDVDLGFVSRDLRSDEKSGMATLSIGAIGTAVVVNATNPVSALRKDQVRAIFSGEIGDWYAVGGRTGPIRVAIREADASTRVAFEEFFFGAEATYTKKAVEVNGIDETMKYIASFPDAIGVVSMNDQSLSNPQLRLLALDGAAATKENLASGAYALRRPLYIVYDPPRVKPVVRAFLDFVAGPEGQRILAGF